MGLTLVVATALIVKITDVPVQILVLQVAVSAIAYFGLLVRFEGRYLRSLWRLIQPEEAMNSTHEAEGLN